MTIIQSTSGKVDLDKGSIEINNEWLSVDDLKQKIKELIAADDFDVSTYTTGLKVLQDELNKYEVVSFKAPSNVVESIRALSEEKSKGFDETLLDALKEYLKLEGIDVQEPAEEPEAEEPEAEEPAAEEEPEPEEAEDVEVEFEIDEAEVEFEDVEDEDEDEDEDKVDETACPRCGGKVPITSTKRPLSIKCPSCGKKGRLLS